MINIAIHIIGWLFIAALVLAFIAVVWYMIELFRYAFSRKSSGPLPWWVFWRP